jgi:hypothetical protein
VYQLGAMRSAGDAQAAGVLAVAPAVLLHPAVPQPDGTLLYELLTGHPDRTPQELVFLADLAVELRAWPAVLAEGTPGGPRWPVFLCLIRR